MAPKHLAALALAALLAGCAAPPVAVVEPLAAPAAATPTPERLATAEPTASLALAPIPTAPPRVEPTLVPPPAPTEEPTPPPAPTPLPNPGDVPLPLSVDRQAPALLPEFVGDLAAAPGWNRYTIDALLDPDALTISGRQTLEFTNRSGGALSQLYFHLYGNHPDLLGSTSVGDVSVDGVGVEPAYEQNGLLLRLDLAQPLPDGATAMVALSFATTTPAGASSGGYGAFNYEAGVWNMASFYPVLAAFGPQGWDTYPVDSRGDLVNSETALYQVRVSAPLGWALATTGVPVADTRDESRQVVTFVSGPQRDFFIAAMTGLDQASALVDGVRVVSYYRPEHAAGGQQALDAAVRSLALFNQQFGRYPLAEFEVVEVAATTFLGVEYPGITLIEQGLYGGGRTLETIVAHEVAHQWWYSLVGNDVQQEAWLDEALASYAQVVYHEGINGPDAAARELDELRARYLRARDAGNDAVVAQPNDQFPRGTYYPIVYGKAPLFLHALRLQLGDELFYRSLQTYYADRRYAVARAPEFVAAVEAGCGCDIDPLFADWITGLAPVAIP